MALCFFYVASSVKIPGYATTNSRAQTQINVDVLPDVGCQTLYEQESRTNRFRLLGLPLFFHTHKLFPKILSFQVESSSACIGLCSLSFRTLFRPLHGVILFVDNAHNQHSRRRLCALSCAPVHGLVLFRPRSPTVRLFHTHLRSLSIFFFAFGLAGSMIFQARILIRSFRNA